ncbi:DEAD/DEAH box helicase [Ornithinimicrobium tianjinense]|uniref:Helicase n=1 Tax=Ornithinimicrobium tianjinense TaxID=1195761 RepID=A0A917BLI7_9MICO|nr:type ISP restriction/modification enzyme [Ornithinimicrobium tianjinense]GGF49106.1 helicase [Ornithinimicrobium tianjinense]
MSTTIYEVLEELRGAATSEADKGSKLERLMLSYLRTDPVFADQFSDVWLWQDWPGRDGKHDTGIDLVAVDRLTGGNVAIQCKFYAPTSTIGKHDIDSFLSASGKQGFNQRIIVSTTEKWNAHAEDALQGQQIPVRRIGLADLEASGVDWGQFTWSAPEELTVSDRKRLRPHQREAVEAVSAGLTTGDRGKLIMACGTGKTFTSLRLSERLVGAGGSVLFLVPSISLLSQTLREWATEAELPLTPIAVCSDRKATARSKATDEDISAVDLALPSTTNVAVLEARLNQALGDDSSMTVVFSTYQSIDVIAQAQSQGELASFDLIVCDEAHRTTGVTLAGEDESAFVRVHDDSYLKGRKRLYMTATPRLYDDSSKAKAGQASAVLASMDDESIYGPELHRLSFGEAVSKDLLTDYKVLVLAVDEASVSRTFQLQLADDGNELRLDDAAKIVGCWNGLAKRGSAEHSFASDPAPMQRAVAFAGTIKDSKQIESLFAQTVEQYAAAHYLEDGETGEPVLACEIRHVDGSFNALERNTRLDWLRAPVPDGTCRILTNARCLSEGVDVPALDAVMFLSPRKSVVDIVQSVGRVMRKAPGKEFGYIILPIGIPAGMTAEEALRDNKKYAVVWEVLQALRAHDERFNAMVNRIELVKARDEKVNVIGVPGAEDRDRESSGGQGVLPLAFLDEWRDAIYAKIVAKVGSRRYWHEWAKDIADIASRHTTRITALLDGGDYKVTKEFDTFLHGLRGILNEGITRDDAVDMLAQHLITRPVFEALFAGYAFTEHNPVAQTMESMLAALDEHNIDDENHSLEKFYDSVRMRVQGVDSAEGRQKLIVQLYDTFFATAFAKTVDRLGIVYTPVEIVDFILRSADDALREHFDQGLSDEGVHILDGFTGTGTFMVRLLQLGLIHPHDLARKYSTELHANEILLLAYYIAAVNIETTYQDIVRGHLDNKAAYQPFPGLVLTDTFQSYEDNDTDALTVFPATSKRIARQRALPITVIVGNPPYSAGQDSANDNNPNVRYPGLDAAIADAYSSKRGRGGNNSLYDAYIRAIRWATLRLGERGVIAYVTNGGWLDSNVGSQMRQSLATEFSDIHIYNLRGNGRVAGEAGRAEGRPVFEFAGWGPSGQEMKSSKGGSRATIAITVFVKDPARSGPAQIHYSQVGDGLSAGQKIRAVSEARSVKSLTDVQLITPNEHGDWLNQRSSQFESFLPLGVKHDLDTDGPAIFGLYGRGLESGRDAWVYQSDRERLADNIDRTIDAFNRQVKGFEQHVQGNAKRPKELVAGFIDTDPRHISWTLSLKNRLAALRPLNHEGFVATAMYRPFFRQHVNFNRGLIHISGQVPRFFPTARHSNIGFYAVNPGSSKPFSVLATDSIPDLALYGSNAGQFFARWRYEAVEDGGLLSLDSDDGEIIDGYRRIDNITDDALTLFRGTYGDTISKDDIFFYCYGILHSPDYRENYQADLKKSLPRIPLVTDPSPYVDAGRRLFELHLGYESIAPHRLEGLDIPAPDGEAAYDFFRVEKMRFDKRHDPATKKHVADRSSIIYNSRITLSGIPEGAYRYLLGSRSAIEWIIDRYQVSTDKDSGIVNDPNDWAREVGDPRYILNLLARIVAVSLETMAVVDGLPRLRVRDTQRMNNVGSEDRSVP